MSPGTPAADALINAAANILGRLVANPTDPTALAGAAEFVRQHKELQLEKLRAIFGAGPNTPGFFGASR